MDGRREDASGCAECYCLGALPSSAAMDEVVVSTQIAASQEVICELISELLTAAADSVVRCRRCARRGSDG
jgi:hypothetical protein